MPSLHPGNFLSFDTLPLCQCHPAFAFEETTPRKGGMDKFCTGETTPLSVPTAFEFASSTAPHSVSPTTCDSQSSGQLRYNMLKHQLSTQTRHTNHKCTAWLFDVSPCFTLFHQVLGCLSCLALSNFRQAGSRVFHWTLLWYKLCLCLIYLVKSIALISASDALLVTGILSLTLSATYWYGALTSTQATSDLNLFTPNSMSFT